MFQKWEGHFRQFLLNQGHRAFRPRRRRDATGRRDYYEASECARARHFQLSGPAGRLSSAAVLSSALRLSPSSERAIVLPTKYKSSVRRSVATAAAALLTSVWWSRGRAFPRLSFKQMNHLFRCRFLEFLGGPGRPRPRGQGATLKPVYQKGPDGMKGIAGWN